MKLSISNIAWQDSDDKQIYSHLMNLGYDALEIAPTKWFAEEPYNHLEEAELHARQLRLEYGFAISSLQSIWFKRTESLFGTEEERLLLLEYTMKAIDFAQHVGCGNLVFGCPRNRVKPEGASDETAVCFFRECGEYAIAHDTCLSLEANPPIYHTNFINETQQAFDMVKKVNSSGFRVNLDMGTMLYYNEPASLIEENLSLINHVHISEPMLAAPKHDDVCREVLEVLNRGGFEGYVSIEMSNAGGLDAVLEVSERIAGMVKSINGR